VMFGKGKQTRDFVYISDVVNALAAAATADRVNRTIVNIGSGQEVSIAQLVDQIERAAGREAHRLMNDEEDSGVPRLVADIRLAGDLLKWKPQVSLDDGLRRILAEDERFRK
jgi:UDP-glucose 4-epimerase